MAILAVIVLVACLIALVPLLERRYQKSDVILLSLGYLIVNGLIGASLFLGALILSIGP